MLCHAIHAKAHEFLQGSRHSYDANHVGRTRLLQVWSGGPTDTRASNKTDCPTTNKHRLAIRKERSGHNQGTRTIRSIQFMPRKGQHINPLSIVQCAHSKCTVGKKLGRVHGDEGSIIRSQGRCSANMGQQTSHIRGRAYGHEPNFALVLFEAGLKIVQVNTSIGGKFNKVLGAAITWEEGWVVVLKCG